MIDFEHVSKEYKKGGRLALEDINLHVDDGEFVFLLGHSCIYCCFFSEISGKMNAKNISIFFSGFGDFFPGFVF